jgi:cobalt/nickel transport system permease protein
LRGRDAKDAPLPHRGRGGGDRFIDKTILALLGLLSAMRAQDERPDAGAPWKATAFWHLLGTLAAIVLVALTREFAFVFVVLTCLLLRLCAMPLADLRKIALLAVIAGSFSFVIMLPAALAGNRYSLTMIPAKAVASVLAVGIHASTSRWTETVHALRRLHVPSTLVFVLDIALKHIFMLGEFSLETLRALKLRSVGRGRGRRGSLAGVTGNLFIRSHQMSEAMYGAMLCRGFAGTYPVSGNVRPTKADLCYIAAGLALVALFLLLRRGGTG